MTTLDQRRAEYEAALDRPLTTWNFYVAVLARAALAAAERDAE